MTRTYASSMKKLRGSAIFQEGHVVGYYDAATYTTPQMVEDLTARGVGWTLVRLTLWCEGVCVYCSKVATTSNLH